MRVVYDTNILISGLLWKGLPYRCLLLAKAGVVELFLCKEIISELSLKLKDKFSIFRNININKLRIDRGMALYELAKKEGLVSKPGFEDETEELTDLPRGGFRAGSVNYYFNETNVGLVYKIYHKILDKSSKIKKGINDKFLKIELLKKIVEII